MSTEAHHYFEVMTQHEQTIERLRAVLRDCEDYFDDRADVLDGESGPLPNREMTMLGLVRAALAQSSDNK